MRLERGELRLSDLHGPTAGGVVVAMEDMKRRARIVMRPADLRWLCLIAGPALLNQLDKQDRGHGDH